MDRRTTLVGTCIGAVAGLVAITPGAGYVTLPAALFIGLCAGVVCNISVRIFKSKFHVVDDTLDVFACHGIGGVLGTVLTGVFASSAVNPAVSDGLLYGGTKVFYANLVGAVAVATFSMAMTWVLFSLVKIFIPLRVPKEMEEVGLDSWHGEAIMSFDEVFIIKKTGSSLDLHH